MSERDPVPSFPNWGLRPVIRRNFINQETFSNTIRINLGTFRQTVKVPYQNLTLKKAGAFKHCQRFTLNGGQTKHL